jgi:hypothetical protein
VPCRTLALAGLLFCAGCAAGVPAPVYKQPPPSSTRAEREKIYAEHKVEWNTHCLAIGGYCYGSILSPESYLIQHGDPDTVDEARIAGHFSWGGFALGLAGAVAAGIYSGAKPSDFKGDGPFYAMLIVPTILDILLTDYGRNEYLPLAAANYNAYLRRNMGLPPQEGQVHP